MLAGIPKPRPPNKVHCRPVPQQRGPCQSDPATAATPQHIVLHLVLLATIGDCEGLVLSACYCPCSPHAAMHLS
jgi:hypothetical protein